MRLARAAAIAAAVGLLAAPALGAGAGVAAPAGADAERPRAERYAADFDAFWKFVSGAYAYFDTKQTDWSRVREIYRPRAEAAGSDSAFLRVLEGALSELYDSHAHLGANTKASPRLVPTGTDLWAEWRDGKAVLTAVRPHSAGERAGLRAGMRVVTVAGAPVEETVAALLPRSLRAPDPAARDWALRVALAGTHDAPVRVTTAAGSGAANDAAAFDFLPGVADPTVPVALEMLAGGVALVKIHNSLGDTGTIAAFDSVLNAARSAKGLLLDLRDTPSGGTSTVARGILGRLVREERPYQRHELPSEEREFGVKRSWVEYVSPRGPFTFDAPVVALVGPWTGSMGEGMAIGLDGMKRATILGTPMAGLLGALYQESLPNTGFVARVPAERLYHVDGRPRERFVPRSPRGESGESGDGSAIGDPLVHEALRVLRGN
ncbi:MAG TPA: S41 family peptidase [Candidatus Eisenbacteria bacterium]|nr:S41 family peptidase [Candidatus Eisenbacteria bacterium]